MSCDEDVFLFTIWFRICISRSKVYLSRYFRRGSYKDYAVDFDRHNICWVIKRLQDVCNLKIFNKQGPIIFLREAARQASSRDNKER